MKKIIFGNSKFRLVLAIFAISLMMIGCGNSTEPTDDKPIVPDEFTLTTVPATLPVEDVWVIANNGSPTKEDFDALEKLLNSDAAKDRKITLNFPNIEAIPANAFFYYDADTDTSTGVETIVAVSAPKALTIGDVAFQFCTALTTVDIPKALTIGDFAFNYCAALTTATFPLATTIGVQAFGYCYALTTVSFPMATTIGGEAFSGTALTTVSFPMATSIGESAFGDCTALTTVNFPVATTIGGFAFEGCTALTTVNFPMATTIQNGAFSSCVALTTANFPMATTIGVNAFYKCAALTTANFPVATTIEKNAFFNCKALTTMEIATGSTLNSIHAYAFDGTTVTANITVTTGSAANKAELEKNGRVFKAIIIKS